MDIPIEAICSLGVGGVFGLVVFLMYRKDRRSSEERNRQDAERHAEQLRQDRVFMEDRMSQIIDRDQETREANTKALTELTTVLERMNGRK